MEKEQILEKVKQVIVGAEQFKRDQFPLILEGLVKRGGREAELLVVKYITLESLAVETRLKVIEAAGQLQSSLFLVPLKKVLDQDPNMYLKKAAIIAIARYGSQQSLNILNNALQTIPNPYLQNTINEQIDGVKKNNPLLALLPRFLKGDKDKKSFTVVVDLLKKNLKPRDAAVFTNYLKSEDNAIQLGAFEILCFCGDRTLQFQIFEFFYQWCRQLQGEPLASLLHSIKHYFLRFPSLIFPQMGRLRTVYLEREDSQVRKNVISVFCHCRAPEALSFIKDIYNRSDPELREFIIEESAGNEQAVEFLFEKYKAGQVLKEKILRALLNTQKGFHFFVQHFLTFGASSQEMIIKSLPHPLQSYMVEFIKTLLQSDLFHLKTFLLRRIGENYLFSCKEILFNPDRDKEYSSLHEEYLNTVTRLFPLASVRYLIEKVALESLEVPRIKEYLNRIFSVTHWEVALNLKDGALFPSLIVKVINACSTELNESFLRLLGNLKTFDMATYKNLYDALNLFINKRGDNLVEEESLAIKRVKENFHQIVSDIKTSEAMEKEVKLIFLKEVPDLIQLKKVFVTYHLGAAFKIKSLIRLMADYFKTMDDRASANWKVLFREFPLLMQLVREARAVIAQKGEPYWSSQWDSRPPGSKTGRSFHHKLRIVIQFEDKELTALFKDQVEEVIPHFTTVVGSCQLKQTDILLCDNQALKNLIKRKALFTNRIYLFLENRGEFAYFKSLNPRAFFQPISIYRVLKLILQELYLLRSS